MGLSAAVAAPSRSEAFEVAQHMSLQSQMLCAGLITMVL